MRVINKLKPTGEMNEQEEAAWDEFSTAYRRRARVHGLAGLAVALGGLALLGLMLWCSGCGTLGKPDPGLVQLVARDAGFIGAQAALTYNPGFRVELELTRQALQAFVAAGKGDVTNLQGILQQHLPGGLGGTTNSMLVVGNGGIILYNAAGAAIAKLDKGQLVSTYAQPIAQGLLQGISQALGMPTSSNEMKLNRELGTAWPKFGPAANQGTTWKSSLPVQTRQSVLSFENGDRGPLYYTVETSADFGRWRKWKEGVAQPGETRLLLDTSQPAEFFRARWN